MNLVLYFNDWCFSEVELKIFHLSFSLVFLITIVVGLRIFEIQAE